MTRVGIFSDVHGNVDALRAVLRAFETRGVERLFCLGDTVGYGGDPNPCCTLVREAAEATVCGNHDTAVAGNMSYDYYYGEARQALDAHREMLDEPSMKWLSSLPFTYQDSSLNALLCHGSPVDPPAFDYVFEPSHVDQIAQKIDASIRIVFVGHSHLIRSFRYWNEDGKRAIENVTAASIHMEPDSTYVVTVGSVGQPRDSDARARAVIYDTDKGTIEFLYVGYDIIEAARKILLHDKLSSGFAKRLFLGV